MQLIALSCMVGFQNYRARHLLYARIMLLAKRSRSLFRLMLWIDNDENMFVSYSYPRFDCKLNACLFEIHGPSFVSSVFYKSAFVDL